MPDSLGGRQDRLREFVGFVWRGDWSQRIGVLVEATEVSEAVAMVKSAYGDEFRVSLWNEDDASSPR